MKVVDIEISENIAGGYSLLVCNREGGEIVHGYKVGGMDTVESFTVPLDVLLEAIKNNTYDTEE
ncbi:hypothetical protein A71_87 [Escherichia phage A7_1]|uniref:Uncharacterized protein n=2 Tax=Vequintavirinae TaxID=1911928 RepID=A0AAF0AQ28_9CAUD|nr:hypothetical protein [Escherichia phage UPEC06]UZZ64165.1 hypothetical protein A71_87 [Escherichia phage A7_1]UZZ64442.1 hypothetical protein A54_202 [Escherichia phage A5-4]WBF77786.1 hypothetical protein A73_168 [Escherichia phage A73]WBF78038.1 hypothetical protein W70_153 [Escherichia phage W70]